jgi:methylenetetrahydrofolate dehydrogenase (NADP+)/methenyltetrahydrofolate cyclohydrolase
VTRGDARLLLGGPIAAEIRLAVAEDVEAYRARAGHAPGLAVVIVGRDAPSMVYLQQILRSCEQGRDRGPPRRDRGRGDGAAVTDAIADLNADPTVNGIIVQMPLPPSIRLRAVVDAIDPAKDIDGIHPLNAGLLRLGYDGFLPATPTPRSRSCAGRHRDRGPPAVVVGRSAVVGHAGRRSCSSGRTRRSRSATRGRAT